MTTAWRLSVVAAVGLVSTAPLHAQDDQMLQRLLDAYRPLMVKIETSGGPDEYCRSEGSGFLVGNKDGRTFVMTASHVIPTHSTCASQMEIFARPSFDPTVEVPLKFEQSTANDVALLSAETSAITDTRPSSFLGLLGTSNSHVCAAPFGAGAQPVDPLVFIGYFPGEADPLPYRGNIETSVSDGRQRIQGLVNKGVSGGPVLNAKGEVIGIVREKVEIDLYGNQVSGKAYITPVSVLLDDLGISLLTPLGQSCFLSSGESGLVAYVTNPGHDERRVIRSTHQIAETLTTQHQGTASEIAAFLLGRVTGSDPPALRYPKQYEQRFAASPGYSFKKVVKTSVLSHNLPGEPLPTTDCSTTDDCIALSPDRKELIVRYRLFSGPSVDQTRGWLEMIVVAEQCRDGFDWYCGT